MRKYADWYILWLKIYGTRVSTWLQLLGMLLLLLVISAIKLPDSSNLKIGIAGSQGDDNRRIIESLLEQDGIFTFILYAGEEELRQDVLWGKLECGFLFSQDLAGKMEEGEHKGCITYLSTPFSVKGEVAKETVYAHFFAVYSEEMLRQKEERLFVEEDPERAEELIRLKREYANSEAVFSMEILSVTIEGTGKEETTSAKVRPLQGMTGFFVFFFMLMAVGRKFIPVKTRFDRALNPVERFGFGFLEKLAAGTFPALAGWILLEWMGESRGLLKEGCALLLLLFFGSLWCQLAAGLFKKETSFMAGALVVLLACLLICPVWVDAGTVVPAVRYLRLIFPVGIYLLG
ncbi:MAG: hypothetical protein IJP31_02790 [Lachnospiraceae bacterium]|nr:hypothetical protein [Lachnospiraceae bacterium]